MQLDDCIRHHARHRGQHIALIHGDRALSYSEFDARVSRCANAMLGFGLKRGDCVALLTANDIAFAEILFASARIGALLIPLNYRLNPAELADILSDASACCLFAQDRYLDPLLAHDAAVAGDTRLIRLGADYERLLAQAPDTAPHIERGPDDPVLVQYTSGTTGKPKGVVSSHRAWVQVSLIEPPLKGIGPDSVFLGVLPMCHTGGAKWVVEVLFAGATLVILDQFSPQGCIDAIERHGVTNVTWVPTMLYQVLDSPAIEGRDLSSLRYVNYGAAPILEARLAEAIERFGCRFTQGYGMTEVAGGSITFAAPSDHVENGAISPRLRSAGRPLIDCELKVVGEDGRTLAAGEVGEIAVRSERTLVGYWRQPASALPVDEHGYFHTGDLGRIDEDGYVYVVDRAKDMIISGGLNIYSKEVEDALLLHPAVAEAYVVGVPDPQWGESVKAVVVRAPGGALDADQAAAWCRDRLASYKKPRFVEFADSAELPRTSLGKVVKKNLRAPDWRTP